MADLCKQCSIETWGEDGRDLAGLDNGDFLALCEGCGYIRINDDGKCIDLQCRKHGIKNLLERVEKVILVMAVIGFLVWRVLV